MFKDIKIKKVVFITLGLIIFFVIIWFLFIKKDNGLGVKPESSFDDDSAPDNEEPENTSNLPGLLHLQYKISMDGKKSVFPMTLEKITDGPIELPNRRSLLNKDAKYKFIDIMPGEKIKAVSLQRLNYTIDHEAFTDDFLVTDNDYLIAFSQAKEHFKIAE